MSCPQQRPVSSVRQRDDGVRDEAVRAATICAANVSDLRGREKRGTEEREVWKPNVEDVLEED